MTSNHSRSGMPSDPERSETGQNVRGSTPRRSFNDIGEIPNPVVDIVRPLGYVSPVEQTSLVKAINPRRIRRRHGISLYYKIERAIYNAVYWTAFWLGVVIVGLWIAVVVTSVVTGYVPW